MEHHFIDVNLTNKVLNRWIPREVCLGFRLTRGVCFCFQLTRKVCRGFRLIMKPCAIIFADKTNAVPTFTLLCYLFEKVYAMVIFLSGFL